MSSLENKVKNPKKNRYDLLDGLRGISIVNMVAFHFLYDYYVICGRNTSWWSLTGVRIWQNYICMSFILLSGFVWKWGRKSNLKRGIFLNACGVAISLVTWLTVPDSVVWFGILNFIGCAVLFMIPLDKILKKIPGSIGIVLSFVLFVLFYNVQKGYLSFGAMNVVELPDVLYQVKFLTPFGFPYPEFVSSDYFPVLPWIFLYILGYYLEEIFERRESWKRAARCRIPVLSWLGQKSIWIYLIHQPVCMAVCMIFFGT